MPMNIGLLTPTIFGVQMQLKACENELDLLECREHNMYIQFVWT
jgi:hypothetical protein